VANRLLQIDFPRGISAVIHRARLRVHKQGLQAGVAIFEKDVLNPRGGPLVIGPVPHS
jgi:hypothetical protein